MYSIFLQINGNMLCLGIDTTTKKAVFSAVKNMNNDTKIVSLDETTAKKTAEKISLHWKTVTKIVKTESIFS